MYYLLCFPRASITKTIYAKRLIKFLVMRQTKMTNSNSKVALYCRLSKDDEQAGDSVSIGTQRMMLTKFCKEHSFEIFDIYIDDGYSGLNFNRPAFQRMINDLESGKFNTLVTKDLSRLGRDYIQTGYYIDVYFVTKGIRYIAINDGIDTLTENNDIAPFKNILNDMYAKDLSRKVKSAKQQRALNGLFISAQAPYGYKVDPENKNRLIIDSEASLIVKEIFNLAKMGYCYSKIAKHLENKQIITPASYKVMNGDTRFLKFATQEHLYKWSYQTIKSILTNSTYVGDMVNHKIEVSNYKTKKRVKIPIENQIIVADTHQAIIDRQTFNLVNTKLSNMQNIKHDYRNDFKNLVFCAECGEQLQLVSKQLKHKNKAMFRCAKHIKDKRQCTHHHFIYYDDLYDEIKKQIYLHICEFINSDKYSSLCETVLYSILQQAQEIRKTQLQRQLQATNKRIKERYKNYTNDDLETLYNLQKSLAIKITDPRKCFDITCLEIESIKASITDYLLKCEISENVLRLLIDKIEVGHLEKEGTSSYQRITVYYKFKA